MMHNKLTVLTWLIAFPLAMSMSCGDDDDDNGGPSQDAGDILYDPTIDEETGPELDLDVVGVYELGSLMLDFGTITTSFQAFPTPELPDRQMRATGGLAARGDGTYLRVFKIIMKEDADSEPVILTPSDDQLAHGDWSTEGDTLTGTDEGEEPDRFTYEYNDTTGILALVAIEPDDGEPLQTTWRRVSLDTQIIGAYDLVSMELSDGTLLTPEGVVVGPNTLKAEGTLVPKGDGTYLRTLQIYINEEVAEEDDTEGIWFTEGTQMIVEEPDIKTLLWEYSFDPAAGTLVLEAVFPDQPAQEMRFELREE